MVSKKYYSMNRDHFYNIRKTFIIKIKKNLKNVLKIDIIVYHLKKIKEGLIILETAIKLA